MEAEGELGRGTTASSSTPVQVSGVTGVTGITAGYQLTCARLGTCAVSCWGEGELGTNSFTASLSPVQVSGIASGAAAVTAGQYHTCAVTNGGALKCWGWNAYGQMGDGTNGSVTTPRSSSNGMTNGAIWVAILGTTGSVAFRDVNDGTGISEGSAQTNLTNLPATWATGAVWTGTTLSANAQ